MYVIGMNGPPRSGKDTLGASLAQRAEGRVQTLALSQAMRLTTYAMLGLDYTVEHYEANKDVPNEMLAGNTIRRAMINLSEHHCKLLYGQNFWNESLLRRLNVGTEVLIVTDIGLQMEATFFASQFDYATVRIHRDGTSYRGDSRGYVDSKNLIDIDNDTTPEASAERVLVWLRSTLNWAI